MKSVADDNRSKRTSPTLLSYTGEGETWNLCNVADDKVLDLHIALPNKRFCGSRGWLITMNENFTVSLIHPFSRLDGRKVKENSITNLPALKIPKSSRFRRPPNSITIPALNLTRKRAKAVIIPTLNIRKILDKKTRTHWAKHCDQYVFKAVISADPILNADDCIVMVAYEPLSQLAFIRLCKDTTWTYIDSDHRNFEEVRYVGDKFYALNAVNEKSQLFSIDITTQFNEEEDVMLVAEDKFEQEEGFFVKRYLVELTENELLMVKRYIFYHPRLRHFRETRKFELFKLDHDSCEWTEINNLGDVALFLGDNTPISVLASSSFGYLPNCIYYLHDWDGYRIVSGNPDDRDFGVYDIENKSFSRAKNPDMGHAAAAGLMKMSNQTPIWTVL